MATKDLARNMFISDSFWSSDSRIFRNNVGKLLCQRFSFFYSIFLFLSISVSISPPIYVALSLSHTLYLSALSPSISLSLCSLTLYISLCSLTLYLPLLFFLFRARRLRSCTRLRSASTRRNSRSSTRCAHSSNSATNASGTAAALDTVDYSSP